MPQGSDFYQKQIRKELKDQCSLENCCKEIDELRERVRNLEEIVHSMSKQLAVTIDNSKWSYWK